MALQRFQGEDGHRPHLVQEGSVRAPRAQLQCCREGRERVRPRPLHSAVTPWFCRGCAPAHCSRLPSHQLTPDLVFLPTTGFLPLPFPRQRPLASTVLPPLRSPGGRGLRLQHRRVLTPVSHGASLRSSLLGMVFPPCSLGTRKESVFPSVSPALLSNPEPKLTSDKAILARGLFLSCISSHVLT